MRSRRRSGCARAGAPRTWRSSSSTPAAGSRRASGATSTCSTAGSTRATRCASSAGSTASATGCSSRSVRSSRSRISIPRRSRPALRRDGDELEGFLEFLAGEISHPGLKAAVGRFVGDDALRASAARTARDRRGPSQLRGRAARAHGRRLDDLPRGGAAPSQAARRSAPRGGAPPRRRPDAPS